MVMVRIIICLIGIVLFGACSANDPQGALPTNMMSTTDTATIRAVQSALRQRHYYHGQVDGFFGQATAVAFERFQNGSRPVRERRYRSVTALGARNNQTLNSRLDGSKAKIVQRLGIRC